MSIAVRGVLSESYFRFSELWYFKSCREMSFKGFDPICTLCSKGECFPFHLSRIVGKWKSIHFSWLQNSEINQQWEQPKFRGENRRPENPAPSGVHQSKSCAVLLHLRCENSSNVGTESRRQAVYSSSFFYSRSSGPDAPG